MMGRLGRVTVSSMVVWGGRQEHMKFNKSCIWGRLTSMHYYRLGIASWKGVGREWVGKTSCWQRPNTWWAAHQECCQQVQGCDLSPLVSIREAYPGLFLLSWASQYERDVDMLESATKGHKDDWGTGVSNIPIRRGWESFSCSVWRKYYFLLQKERERLIHHWIEIPDGREQRRQSQALFPVVPTNRTRVNGNKLKYMKLHLNTRMHCFGFFVLFC